MKQSDDAFLTSLLSILKPYTKQSFRIAYSGGMDSHVLLHAMASLHKTGAISAVRAMHIDHGLQADSVLWSKHCEKTASQLGTPCEIIELNLHVPDGKSVEAVAREARYAAMENAVEDNEVLLTAHHQNDQAETVLLQLFRGSGVDGLAAMPVSKPFSGGILLRPLLGFSRQTVENYAEKHHLDYIDDPSNFDVDFDRNFLRHDVIPLLQRRWKGINKSLARVARLQAEAKALLDVNAQTDLDAVVCHNVDQNIIEKNQQVLCVAVLLQLPEYRQKALIRLWLKQSGFKMPSEIKLKHILSDVLCAQASANPCVHWENVEIRRYKNKLYAVKKLLKHKMTRVISWDAKQPLLLDELACTLEPTKLGTWQTKLQQSDKVSIRFRQGGEKIRLQGHKQTASLKKLLQASNIPPWERERIPLIYLDEKLVIVYPYWSAEE